MRTVRPLVLICIGGLLYTLCELLYRGHSHWTMFLVGGLCFFFVGEINELIPWEMPLWQQALIGAAIVTVVEFLSGCVINLWLRLDVWDYSGVPFNVLGQICLPFSLIWIFLSAIGIFLDDFLRWFLFDEDFPRYKLF